jgi:hypothetical protein
MAPSAVAQTSPAAGPNNGAIRFTGGVDVPSVYVFRGILQETDPRLTLWPYGDLGLALHPAVTLNLGVWHSVQTGSSGTQGPSGHAHYEENFYTTLNLGLGAGIGLGATYMALTSPNNMFNTVKEFQVKLTQASILNPYGFLAFELTRGGQADGGANKGSYLELGVGPTFPLGGSKVTLTIPAKLGVSLKDYYELNGSDRKFGFFDIGGLVTMPLSDASSPYGSWNLHGGVDILAFGDFTKAANGGTASKVVGLVGVGLSY